jgi:hypothetical protein
MLWSYGAASEVAVRPETDAGRLQGWPSFERLRSVPPTSSRFASVDDHSSYRHFLELSASVNDV